MNKKIILILITLFVFMISCVPDPLTCTRTGEVIGLVTVDLDLSSKSIRTKEAPIGNYIADSVMEFLDNDNMSEIRLQQYFHVTGDFKVDFAIVNAGNIRHCNFSDKIEAGTDFTTGMIDELLPFKSNVYVVQVRGDELKQILEHSVAKIEDTKGQFLQFSKELSITVDKTKAPEIINKINETESEISFPGERIVSVKLNGNIIDDNIAIYYVATSGYIATGGDDYLTFAEMGDEKRLDMLNTYNVLLDKYIRSVIKIDPTVEGRINFVNE